jgi:hypothetical protein
VRLSIFSVTFSRLSGSFRHRSVGVLIHEPRRLVDEIRPRAVHARAIFRAGMPGGTQEPAPLTRFPSQPLYGAPLPAGVALNQPHSRDADGYAVRWLSLVPCCSVCLRMLADRTR